MSFLSPIWFFALAALSIPVAIHLWNIRPGKTLKVGSISLISEASKSTSRSFQLMDLLLLLLRCLLLALLAFFLASPVWQQKAEANKAKGWVLIPKESFRESYRQFKPRVDSLVKAGYELHYFNQNFGKIDTAKLQAAIDTKDSFSYANYWDLLRQLDVQVRAALPVVLFTPNGLTHYKGDRPSVNLNLNWQTYAAADSTRRWISSACFTNGDAIKVTVANSSPSGTYFTNKYVRNDGDAEIAVSVQNGTPSVSLKKLNDPPFPVDTSTLRIAVYTDKYGVDAGYLNAALNAVVKFDGRKSVIRQYNNPAQIPSGQTWLFWLSDEPMNSQLINSTTNIFKYETGKAATVSSWISADGQYALPNGDQKITLFKLIGAGKNITPVWQDGFGRPVLGVEKNRTNTYHFYSHFNPAWNELVWNDDFPKMMLKLINGDNKPIAASYDKRILVDQQLQPNIIKEAKEVVEIKPTERVDLSKYFWFLLIILFIAERWLAHRTKTPTNG